MDHDPFPIYLPQRSFVCRRTVNRRDWDVIQPQVDTQLSAMMNDMVDAKTSQYGEAGHRQYRLAGSQQGPVLHQMLIAGARDGPVTRFAVLVEYFQHLLS